MKRFYFHIRVEGGIIPDEEGLVFQDLVSALAELRASARELSGRDEFVEMTDAKGTVVASMQASVALQ